MSSNPTKPCIQRRWMMLLRLAHEIVLSLPYTCVHMHPRTHTSTCAHTNAFKKDSAQTANQNTEHSPNSRRCNIKMNIVAFQKFLPFPVLLILQERYPLSRLLQDRFGFASFCCGMNGIILGGIPASGFFPSMFVGITWWCNVVGLSFAAALCSFSEFPGV